MNLLVIRPQPGADATARRILARGFHPLVMPLFAVSAVPWTWPENPAYDAILLTSAHAPAAGAAMLHRAPHLPVYAVGPKTARAARAAGFTVAAAGDRDVKAATDIAASHGRRHLLWLAGADHIALPPCDDLRIDKVIVYRAAALAAPDDFDIVTSKADWVLLHSPRAAQYFRGLCEQQKCAIDALSIAAFSANVADAAGQGWHRKLVAPRTDDAALIAAITAAI